MRRSKLEIYIDILATLAFDGQLQITHIMNKANINCQVLRELLEFLIQNNLVEEKNRKKRIVYSITPRGMKILKAFEEIKQLFPLEGEKEHNQFLF
jgi:predicted transcriptional regulator